MASGAVLSPDLLYRYVLRRSWAPGQLVTWVMLNPSTADADTDDHTIRRCISLSRQWGMGGLAVVNLYAWRATDPSELYVVDDPVGPGNPAAIDRWCDRADVVVVAWGAHASGVERRRGRGTSPVTLVRTVRRDLWCLGTNADRSPRHPARLPDGIQLKAWV